MLVEDVRLAKKVIEFKRTEGLYEILVVSKDLSDDLIGLGLSDDWFVLPKSVAQPLGALIDLFRDVDYDLGLDDRVGGKPLKDRVYKIVDDEDLPIESGVEDGLYSVFLKLNELFTLAGNTQIEYSFDEVVDGVSQKITGRSYTISLHLIVGKYISNLLDEKRIRYSEIVNKYWRNNSFAFNTNRNEGKGDKLAKYTSNLGHKCYVGIKFFEGRIEARLMVYLDRSDSSI